MPDDPKRLQVIDRIVEVLKNIVQGDDYFYTPYLVTKQFVHWAGLQGFPTYLVYTGESAEPEIHGTPDMYDETFFVEIEGAIQDQVDTVTIMERALRDVRKAINEDSKSGAAGSLGVIAIETMISDLSDVVFQTESPYAFFKQRVRVRISGDFGEL
jgi:hypothetical protein